MTKGGNLNKIYYNFICKYHSMFSDTAIIFQNIILKYFQIF
jgi:hypothetical protein